MSEREALAVAILIALQVTDLVTTRIGLAAGKREGNPLGRWLLERFGFAGLAVVKILGTAGVIALVFACLDDPLPGLAAFAVLMAGVVGWNLYQVTKG